MSLLTQQNFINVKLYYQLITSKSGQKVKVLEDKDAEELIQKNAENKKAFEENEENADKEFKLEPNKEVHVLNTKWKNVSWKDQNTSLKSCTMKNDITGELEIDQLKFRDIK